MWLDKVGKLLVPEGANYGHIQILTLIQYVDNNICINFFFISTSVPLVAICIYAVRKSTFDPVKFGQSAAGFIAELT